MEKRTNIEHNKTDVIWLASNVRMDSYVDFGYESNMTAKEDLQAKIREYQTRVGHLMERHRTLLNQATEVRTEADLIKARINGMLEAIEYLSPPPADAVPVPSPPARRRNRSLSGHWRQIMQHAASVPDFDYDDLAIMAELVGHPVSRDNLRSQMALYKTAQIVEALGDGRFRITPRGRIVAGLDEPGAEDASNENGPPDDALERMLGGPDTGETGGATPVDPPSNPSPSGSTS